jgi:hypothetical protein
MKHYRQLTVGVMATSATPIEIFIPKRLAFLEAICWQTEDVYRLPLEQMLSRYERGWRYRQLFGNPEGDELDFLKKLAKHYQSWLQADL